MADRGILVAVLACLTIKKNEGGDRIGQLRHMSAFNPSTQEAEASGSLCEASLLYIGRACLKAKQTNKQTNKQNNNKAPELYPVTVIQLIMFIILAHGHYPL